MYYIIAGGGLYALDHLLRLCKTRLCSARIRPLPELDTTRIEVPHVNAGWRAGQHVRIRVLTTGMGWFGWAEAHPFTIASVSEGPEGMVLMCKKGGRWTQRLYELGTAARHQVEEGGGCTTRVLVEGPYGEFSVFFKLWLLWHRLSSLRQAGLGTRCLRVILRRCSLWGGAGFRLRWRRYRSSSRWTTRRRAASKRSSWCGACGIPASVSP